MGVRVADMILGVRRRAGLPQTFGAVQATRPHVVPTQPGDFIDEEIAVIASTQMTSFVVPAIVALQEAFFRQRIVLPLEPETTVPAEAMAYRTTLVSIREVGRSRLEPLSLYSAGQVVYGRLGYEVYGDRLALTFDPPSGYELVIDYFLRPPALTTLDGRVVDKTTSAEIDTPQLVIQQGDVLWSTAESQPFRTGPLTTVGATSAPQYGLSDLTAVEVGDLVTLVGYSSIVPFPMEAVGVLEQATANQILQSLGDNQALAYGQQMLQQDLSAMKLMLGKRNDGNPKVVTRRHSRFARGLRGRRAWFGGL